MHSYTKLNYIDQLGILVRINLKTVHTLSTFPILKAHLTMHCIESPAHVISKKSRDSEVEQA